MKKEPFVYTLIILLGFISFSSFGQIDSSLAPYCYLNPGQSINSKWAEMNPQINSNDSKLFFVREDHKKNKHFQEIWCSEKDVDDQWKPAYKLPAPLNRGLTNSVVYVSPDGKDLLVKGFYKKGKYKTRGFSIAHYKDNKWSTPEGIKIEGYKDLDNGIYNNACMSPDEKVIIFSFCEKKAETENNLYISFKNENNTFSKPQKFIEPINVEGSFDFSPFISDDGKYLFFSSDRAGGMGGNDIYKCERLDDTWLKWSEPENMGPRVNTSGRDSYFSMDASGNFGYMVTDINAFGKSDIVVVKLKDQIPQSLFGQVIDSVLNKKVPAKIKIQNPAKADDTITVSTDSSGAYEVSLTNFGHYLFDINSVGYAQKVDTFLVAKNNKKVERTTITHYLSGVKLKKVNIQTKDKKPLKVKIKGTELKEGSGETDREGKLVFNLKEGNIYNIEINKIGFEEYRKSFTVPVSKNKTDSAFTFLIELKALKPILENIYFDNNKSSTNFFPESTILNILDYLKENENTKLQISGHTDDVGSEAYNMELSKRRAHFVAVYLTNKGVEKTKIITKGYGETKPLFKDTSAASRAKNRRIEFLFVE